MNKPRRCEYGDVAQADLEASEHAEQAKKDGFSYACKAQATETWEPGGRVIHVCAKHGAEARKWDAMFNQFSIERKAGTAGKAGIS